MAKSKVKAKESKVSKPSVVQGKAKVEKTQPGKDKKNLAGLKKKASQAKKIPVKEVSSSSESSSSESDDSSSSSSSSSESESESETSSGSESEEKVPIPSKTASSSKAKAASSTESSDESSSSEESSSSSSSSGSDSDSDSDSSDSDSESEEEKSKKPATQKKAEKAKPSSSSSSSSSSESSSSESESESESSDSESESENKKKPKETATPKKTALSAKSSSSSESSSSEEDSSADSSESGSDSESSSADSDSDSDSDSESESEVEDKKPAKELAPKRKASEAISAESKKQKAETVDSGESRTLFVGRLSWNVDEDALKDAFNHIGPIESARIIYDKQSGKHRGYGYIDFTESSSVSKAINEMQGAEIDGRPVNLDASTGKPATPSASSRASQYGDVLSDPSDTIFVGNVSFNCDRDTLFETFGEYGNVIGVRLPTNPETEQLKGFGYVQFDSIDSAKAALEALNGVEIAGRSVRLDYSKPRDRPPQDSPSRGGRGGGGRGGSFGRGGRGGNGGRGGRGGFGGGQSRGGNNNRSVSSNRGGFGAATGKKITFD